MTDVRPSKIRKTAPYKLFYWPSIPGRGEFVRLAFEYSGTPYVESTDPETLLSTITNAKHTGGAPPAFAPPALELPNGRFLSQTPSILNFLAPKLGLAGWNEDDSTLDDDEKEEIRASVNQVVLTALDLNNETHDSHHPIASSQYYEDQKDVAVKRSTDFRATRLPKYFGHFENVLAANPANKDDNGPFCVSSQTTTADLVVFHVIDGLLFAFPKRVAALRASGQFPLLFKLHGRVKAEESINAYLESDRRSPFSNGVFRYYPELDGEL